MTPQARRALVEAIHDTPTMLVLAVAGGGNAVVTDLLDVPGASRTILEIRVPYAASAMADLLALDDDEPWDEPTAAAVSTSTAQTMAEACLERAHHLSADHHDVVGVACTAALASDRPKRGDHRAHIAVASGRPRSQSSGPAMRVEQKKIELEKERHDRSGEDRIVADAILKMIATACGLTAGGPTVTPEPGSPEPVFNDTADWTWVLERRCPECGFDASQTPATDVSTLLRANAGRWQELLSFDPALLRTRPRPDRWSPLEYAYHVRDVFEIYDHRLQLMVEKNGPSYPNWDQDATAVEKDYRSADPSKLSLELAHWADALAVRFDSVGDDQWDRTGFRSDRAEFTIDTFARYFIHDPIHHLYDVREATSSHQGST